MEIWLLKILTLQNWRQKLMDVLFDANTQNPGIGFMEYDAFFGGRYIYSHLDSDIARLMRFSQGLSLRSESFEIICFPWQTGFLKMFLGPRVVLKEIDPNIVFQALDIKEASFEPKQ